MNIRPYADTLIATIHHLFPKGTEAVQGKLFAVTVRIDFDDYDRAVEMPSVTGFVHLVVRAPNNYVQVLAAFTDRPRHWRDIAGWSCVCHHDSAWREDGINATLFCAYRELSDQAASTFGVPANRLSAHISIDNMGIGNASDILGGIRVEDVPDGRLSLGVPLQSK